MRKINLLLVRRNLLLGPTGGGGGKVLQTFAKYMDKKIFNISFCSFQRGDLEGRIKRSGFKVHSIQGIDPERFAKLVKEKKIDVVYFVPWGEHPELIKAAKRGGASAISFMDNAGKIIDPEVTRLVDRQLASKFCAVRYRRWYNFHGEDFHKNHWVVYCPIDFELFKKYTLSKKEVLQERKKLGIEPGTFVIGRIGRADPGKWDDILIDMMPHLVKKVPKVKFMIMGIPEGKREKIRMKNLDKYFIFVEPDPSDAKVVEFLSMIDAFVYASVQGETFGMAIAEAMMAKKPVVVSSTPMVDNAQIELVDNGRTGFVVYTPEAFADAVAYLAANPEVAERMGLAGYEKARREFDAEKITRMVERSILELLAEKGYKIPKKILNRYGDAGKFPTAKDIDDFDQEYRRRLWDVVGKPDFIKIFIGEHISLSWVMQRFIRSTKLTDLRNAVRKLAAK